MSSILLIQSDPAESARYVEALGAEPSFAVSAAVETIAEARGAIAKRIPDLIIADLRLHDGPLTNLLTDLRPGRSHVIAITASLRDPHLMHTLRHGADGYHLEGRTPEVLLALVRLVLAGESPMAPEIARQIMAQVDALNTRPIAAGAQGPLYLTHAEHRMLEWVGEGFLPREIARGLNLTVQQVGLLTRAVYRRLQMDLRTRQGAVRPR